nr:MAG TPA: hypothetical protein [Caudoviricetes sp.]
MVADCEAGAHGLAQEVSQVTVLGPSPLPGEGALELPQFQLKRWSWGWSVPDFLHRLAV